VVPLHLPSTQVGLEVTRVQPSGPCQLWHRKLLPRLGWLHQQQHPTDRVCIGSNTLQKYIGGIQHIHSIYTAPQLHSIQAPTYQSQHGTLVARCIHERVMHRMVCSRLEGMVTRRQISCSSCITTRTSNPKHTASGEANELQQTMASMARRQPAQVTSKFVSETTERPLVGRPRRQRTICMALHQA